MVRKRKPVNRCLRPAAHIQKTGRKREEEKKSLLAYFQ